MILLCSEKLQGEYYLQVKIEDGEPPQARFIFDLKQFNDTDTLDWWPAENLFSPDILENDIIKQHDVDAVSILLRKHKLSQI